MSEFLNEPELDKYSDSHERTDDGIIGFKDGEFTYYGVPQAPDSPSGLDQHSFVLRNVNVMFPAGKVSAIVGPTGSGKTSLLAALLGEMKKVTGRYSIPEGHIFSLEAEKSKVCYVPQTAWLMNATIRDNILFGEPYDEKRYASVISACALRRDLETLDNGDLTEIGEKGVNLSGIVI
jgi:ABC-type multidrug transport system fused ATPase/permease subunit